MIFAFHSHLFCIFDCCEYKHRKWKHLLMAYSKYRKFMNILVLKAYEVWVTELFSRLRIICIRQFTWKRVGLYFLHKEEPCFNSNSAYFLSMLLACIYDITLIGWKCYYSILLMHLHSWAEAQNAQTKNIFYLHALRLLGKERSHVSLNTFWYGLVKWYKWGYHCVFQEKHNEFVAIISVRYIQKYYCHKHHYKITNSELKHMVACLCP